MQHVRFGQLPLQFLLEVVCQAPLMRESLKCVLLVDEAKTEKLMTVGAAFGGFGGGGYGLGMGMSGGASGSGDAQQHRPAAQPILSLMERSLPRRSYAGLYPSLPQVYSH